MGERLNDVQYDRIDTIELGFFNTNVSSEILRRYLAAMSESSSVG